LIICQQAEQDRTTLTKKVQEIEATLTKKEELRLTAQLKLGRATELADDAQRFVASVTQTMTLSETRQARYLDEASSSFLSQNVQRPGG